ncbi:MAG TPA: hypothetical protein VGA22_05855 [Gemmatimonadales bacterium]
MTMQDALATWLLGHTERITFGPPYVEHDVLLVDATVHVACKHLTTGADGNGKVACAAHGFAGYLPNPSQSARDTRAPFTRGSRHLVSFKQRRRVLHLPLKRAPQRTLPVLQSPNPCVDAPCRTADNTKGAACCRDLTLEIVAPDADPHLELLLRARRSPYLCKVTRTGPTMLECEVISACGYLDPSDGVGCVLHNRLLPNGRSAKPSICWDWPDIGPDEVTHPGCRLA